MELRHLRYFVAVAEHLHFGRAAAALRLAQPSLSRQIRQLEEEVGVDLIDRTDRRHVQLTAAGVAFLEGARETLAMAERSAHEARRAAESESGRLSVAFVPSILQAPQAARILQRFRDRQPSVRVEISSMRTLEQWDALRSGRVQLGFLYHPPEDARIETRALWRQSIFLAVPEGHELQRGPAVTLRRLAREPFIWFDRSLSPSYYDLVRRAFESQGLAMSVAQEATTESARLNLVANRLGVTLVPGGWGAAPPPGVQMRPVSDLDEQLQVYVAFEPARLSRAADAFVCELGAALQRPHVVRAE